MRWVASSIGYWANNRIGTSYTPIAARTTLERDGKRRRSPKRGSVYSLFEELVSIPTLLDNPNLTLDVVLVEQTKQQIHDPRARRGRVRLANR